MISVVQRQQDKVVVLQEERNRALTCQWKKSVDDASHTLVS